MNYNANTGGRPIGRKLKRVADVNSMGYTPFEQTASPAPTQQNVYPNLDPNINAFQSPGFVPMEQQYSGTPKLTPGQSFNQPFSQPGATMTPNLNILNQPVVQDMVMQYGQQLGGAGKTILKNEVEKFVPISKLKYYFSVDTKYVMTKLLLLFFPFTHKDWSVKYEQDGPVQPRFEINAPDLYIPVMGYVTYVLTAGLVLGMQDRFSPEQIGILASSALAWCIVELAVYCATMYVMQVETTLKTLDLLAYAGYKFVGIICAISTSIVMGRIGYYGCLVYTSISLAFFLIRSLKVQILAESTQDTSYYGASPNATGRKRRLYFLLSLAAVQPILSWWLSYHLLPIQKVTEAIPVSQ